MSFVRFFVIVIVSLIVQNEAARILAVYPAPSISHQVVFRPLTLELLKRGHEVVVLTADPMFEKEKAPTNLTEIDVHELSYKTWRDGFVHASVTQGNTEDMLTQMSTLFKVSVNLQEKQLAVSEMQALLNDKSQKFDLLILEAYTTPMLGLATKFDAPIIQISSFGAFSDFLRTVGAPIHPLLYPTCLQQKTHNFSFFEKIQHPNIKLFITQGGLQSTDEAITAGVPLIGMPMLGDQWFNTEQFVLNKIGLRVDMSTITEEKLQTAIGTIVNDKSYRENIVRLRNIMRDQPQTPLERATWWVEYVIRHKGAKHLRSPAANMPLTEYLELELISYLLFGLLSVIVILSSAVYYLYSLYKRYRLSIKVKRN